MRPRFVRAACPDPDAPEHCVSSMIEPKQMRAANAPRDRGTCTCMGMLAASLAATTLLACSSGTPVVTDDTSSVSIDNSAEQPSRSEGTSLAAVGGSTGTGGQGRRAAGGVGGSTRPAQAAGAGVSAGGISGQGSAAGSGGALGGKTSAAGSCGTDTTASQVGPSRTP